MKTDIITVSAAVKAAFTAQTVKLVLSDPTAAAEHIKVTAARKDEGYFFESLTKTQAFHGSYTFQDALKKVELLLTEQFRQGNFWTEDRESSIRISKKGRVLTNAGAAAPQKKLPSDNRKKNYPINEGDIVPPLVDMGVFTPDGRVVKAKWDKYKQINKFAEIIGEHVHDIGRPLRIVDFGCGKSYLTFILYHYFTRVRGIPVNMTGMDLKQEVIDKCRLSAEKYGYSSLSFLVGDITEYDPPEPPDIVICLHACDTATDLALAQAVKWNADMIFAVPCCQHELNAQLKATSLDIMEKYGIVKERFAALLTDSIRSNMLEYSGYAVDVMEFVDLSHTPKNLMIRAKRSNVSQNKKSRAMAQVKEAMEAFSLDPTIYRMLGEK